MLLKTIIYSVLLAAFGLTEMMPAKAQVTGFDRHLDEVPLVVNERINSKSIGEMGIFREHLLGQSSETIDNRAERYKQYFQEFNLEYKIIKASGRENKKY